MNQPDTAQSQDGLFPNVSVDRWKQLSPLTRTTAYLIGLTAAFVILLWAFPAVRGTLAELSPSQSTVNNITSAFQSQVESPSQSLPLFERGVVVLALLLASLLTVAPIAWMYMVTKRQEGYDKTFVQVLILLPIVVTAVVRVVRGDLALAFALAGIVAAVRFRTTLRDLKNAVFAFAAIGIGLASGTGSFLLSVLLSLVFCVTVFALWKRRIGEVDSALAEQSGPMRLAEALVPGEAQRSVAVGSSELVRPLSASEIEKRRDNINRLAHFVRADALKSSNKYDTLLLIYATEVEASRGVAEDLIGEYAERWHLVDTFSGPDETHVLEYLVRLSDDAEIGDFLHKLGCGDDSPLRAAEMKRMKGLRKMMR